MSLVEPLFIVGCIRSGTTILHDVMTQFCPQAIDIDDVDFECRTFWQTRGVAIGSPKTGTRCPPADASSVTPAQAAEIRAYFARRAGRERHIVNKNPHLSNKLGLLWALFPQARVVHIVREIYSVVASTKLRFLAAAERENYARVPFVAYWPAEEHLPCWWTVPMARGRAPFSLKHFAKRLLAGRNAPPAAQHDDPQQFRAEFGDASRYYPGEGFARIPESWLKINAGVIEQVRGLRMESHYLPVNYDDLVTNTPQALARIAQFCGIEQVAPQRVPQTLDASRRDKWRKDLSAAEQRSVCEMVERFAAQAGLISQTVPGAVLPAQMTVA